MTNLPLSRKAADRLPCLAPSPISLKGAGPTPEIRLEALTTRVLRALSKSAQERLGEELSELYRQAFPKMTTELREEFLQNYFKTTREGFHRQALFFRDPEDRLHGTALFDQGMVTHGEARLRAIYINARAIRPESQGASLGKEIASRILSELAPDILFTTATQSASLHSWIGMGRRPAGADFEVWPRITEDRPDRFFTLPPDRMPLILGAFRQAYREINPDGELSVRRALDNLTPRMVRRNLQDRVYDFEAWFREDRPDPLANHLNLTERDGVLVVFLRKALPGAQEGHQPHR